MKISIVGNCQIDGLFNLLVKNKSDVVKLSVHSSTESQIKEFQNRVKKSDILISTLTKNEYRDNIGLGSDYLRSLLPNGSLCIVIPSIYYKGYYPTVSSFSEFDALSFNHKQKIFRTSKYHDYIPMILAENKILDVSYEKISSCKNDNIKTIVKKNHEKSIKELQERELQCDVKISDFLIGKYHKEQSFLTFNHPKNNILFEAYKRIANEMKNKTGDAIHFDLFSKNDLINHNDEVTIHQFVQDSICTKEICDHRYRDEDFKIVVRFYFDKNKYPCHRNEAYENARKILEFAGVL